MTNKPQQLPEWRKALNQAVENYQSTRSWYEENRDSLSAEQDMDAAAGEIEKLIKQYGVLIVLNLLDEIDELQERAAGAQATLSRLAVIMHGSETDLNLLTVTAQSLMDRCRADGAPAPVIPDEKPMPESSKMYAIDAVAAIAEVRGWNACRAAMLQAGNHTEQHLDMVDHSGDANKIGKDGTLINEGTIPATRFQQVADLYGITSATGSETSFTFDAFEASSFAKGGWYVQEYVELERYQKAVVGNSPETPDGYVLVPVELTCAMDDAAWEAYHETRSMSDIWAALLAVAPQQEVTSARVHPARNK